jgi:hypothetical protein
MRAPAPTPVISAWESSSKLVSKGLLDDMLDFFKSGRVKRTMLNGAICLDSHIGSGGIRSRSDIGIDAYHLQCMVFFSWQASVGLVEFNQVERLVLSLCYCGHQRGPGYCLTPWWCCPHCTTQQQCCAWVWGTFCGAGESMPSWLQ